MTRPFHHMSRDDILQRLRRSRKQIYERCKGFLEVVSHKDSTYRPFRTEIVKFVHRSLDEFLQKRDIQDRMAPYLVGFDALDFHRQALLAELKSIGWTEEYYIEHGRFGFQSDVEISMQLFTHSRSSDSARFCIFLDQLALIVNSQLPPGKKGYVEVYMPFTWGVDSRGIQTAKVQSHPAAQIRFLAAMYGIYEYMEWKPIESVTQESHEKDEMLAFVQNPATYRISIPQDRLVKTIVYCFEHGISANCNTIFSGIGSYWQRILWENIVATPNWKFESLEFEPTIRVFLLYGADPYFWLQFGPQYKDEDGQKVIRVVAQLGKERIVKYTTIYLDVASERVVKFAKQKGWILSLRDLVEFWFPDRAKLLQELIDRNAARQGDITNDELRELKATFDLDLSLWAGPGFKKDKCLFTSFISLRDFEVNKTKYTLIHDD
jgi:hypothetical protein